jgi:peptide deformylase
VALQQIRIIGDPVLRTPAEPVMTFDKELRTLVRDLTDTMDHAPGVGLAALRSVSASASSPTTAATTPRATSSTR